MGEFPRVTAGTDVSDLLLNSRWLNAVTEQLAVPPERPPELAGIKGVFEIMITSTIPAADWDPALKKRTPKWVSQPRFYTKDGADFYAPEAKIGFWHKSKKEITITAGKGRFGLVIAHRLVWVDCEEVDLA